MDHRIVERIRQGWRTELRASAAFRGPGRHVHLRRRDDPTDPRWVGVVTLEASTCVSLPPSAPGRLHDLQRRDLDADLTDAAVVARVIGPVEGFLGPGYTPQEIFAEAQRVVRWHYQWLVLHEFLPMTVGQGMVDDVLSGGPQHFKWRNDPFIPVEFSVAAYRFGHSQIRPSYRANFATSASDPSQQFFALFLDPGATDPDDPADLRGGRRAPRRFLDWQTFFDFGGGRVRPNKKIDTTLSSVLFTLLGQPEGEPISLAIRNLLRNLTMKVPSGQRVAQAMQLPELAPGDLDDLQALHLHQRTPLWFYVLRETEVAASGEHLGPVGGRIVAEVIVGLIEGDRQSYLRQDPDWTPTYGTGDSFTMVDLLTTAGVVATIP